MRLLEVNSSPHESIFDESIGDVRLVVEPGRDQKRTLWFKGNIVTARSIDDYERHNAIPTDIVKFLGKDTKNIYEVGGGLAELLPYLSQSTNHHCVNIDPLPHKNVIELLHMAHPVVQTDEARLAITTLLDRAEILASSNIQTINMTLEEAYSEFYEQLCKSAHVVIDVYAAMVYSPEKSTVEILERDWLLNNEFTDFVWKPGAF